MDSYTGTTNFLTTDVLRLTMKDLDRSVWNVKLRDASHVWNQVLTNARIKTSLNLYHRHHLNSHWLISTQLQKRFKNLATKQPSALVFAGLICREWRLSSLWWIQRMFDFRWKFILCFRHHNDRVIFICDVDASDSNIRRERNSDSGCKDTEFLGRWSNRQNFNRKSDQLVQQ